MTSWCFFYELAFFLWFFHLMMWTQGNPNKKLLYIWISFWGKIMYFHKAKLILWLDLGPCDRTKVNRLQRCPRLSLGRVSSSPSSWNQPSDTFVTEVSLKHLHWRWHQPQRRTHLHRQQSKFPGFWEIIDSPMTFGMTSQFPILRTRNRVLELAPTGSKELTVHISSHLYTGRLKSAMREYLYHGNWQTLCIRASPLPWRASIPLYPMEMKTESKWLCQCHTAQ